ncbi:MAG TPA: CDP-glucose 4,6-dehydratase [Terracidiphilus sp.]|nr:CDP-glucose 4,6-dehydratase [Terracidiphilus sp.]
MEDVVNPWKDRRVFLTGHTGFKGSWLALWLANRGARIRGYSLDPPTEPNLFTVASVDRVLDDVRGDIRDSAKLESAIAGFAPEIIFHLAAQPLVRRSYADPLGTYATNVMGTAHVLEAVRKTIGVRAVVCVTTDKCYENREWAWPYREIDTLGGHDPYSSSKACAELVCAAYRSSYFLGHPPVGLATARAGNVIGGGDWAEDRLIPDLIRGFQSGQPVLIRRPNAVRPWQHVLDPLSGYIQLAENLFAGRAQCASAYNFGPGDEEPRPVEAIAAKLADLWGSGANWSVDCSSDLHETHFLCLDASKARAELGWKPRLCIERALEWTVNWYRSWLAGNDMHEKTMEQIASYERLNS